MENVYVVVMDESAVDVYRVEPVLHGAFSSKDLAKKAVMEQLVSHSNGIEITVEMVEGRIYKVKVDDPKTKIPLPSYYE